MKNQYQIKKKIIFFASILIFISCYIDLAKQIKNGNKRIKSPIEENAGIKESIPLEAVEIKKIAATYKLDNFNLSNKILEDEYLKQSIIEYLYPLRLENKTTSFFYLNNESDLKEKGCVELAKSSLTILYQCKKY
jgi:hypothetical protein